MVPRFASFGDAELRELDLGDAELRELQQRPSLPAGVLAPARGPAPRGRRSRRRYRTS